jgi:hypothetical protein
MYKITYCCNPQNQSLNIKLPEIRKHIRDNVVLFYFFQILVECQQILREDIWGGIKSFDASLFQLKEVLHTHETELM